MAENENLTAEQEKQINEAYDKMLNAADTYKETGEQSQEAYDSLKKELADAALEKTTDELAKGMAKFCKGESEHPTNPTTDKKNPLTEGGREALLYSVNVNVVYKGKIIANVTTLREELVE